MENKSFEVLMKELDDLVVSLESGETRLEEALKLYKNGIGIIELLSKKLEDARKQIETVSVNAKKDEDNE